MLAAVLILTAGYLAYLIWEKRTNDACLAGFRWVIHVNGVRGKSSVCRMLDAHLRGAGFRVFTKTTGTAPTCIGVDGVERPLARRGSANVKEQLAVIRRARREGAQVLILECMAVKPELQQVSQAQIVQAGVGVITNVRYDHVFDMGGSLEAIAESLSATIPRDGVLFTADEAFFPYFQARCREKHTRASLCAPGEYGENEALAVAVGEYLGVSGATFGAHMAGYQADFGVYKRYEAAGRVFLNLFSVNDPQSTRRLLETCCPDTAGAVFLYNHRADRLDRLLLFVRCFFSEVPYRKILVMGENRAFACRLLRRSGHQQVEVAPSWRWALEAAGEAPLVGIGNIKGAGYEMIEYFERDGGYE